MFLRLIALPFLLLLAWLMPPSEPSPHYSGADDLPEDWDAIGENARMTVVGMP